MSLKERAENLVTFARNSNANELDNVVKAIVNFAREERIKILTDVFNNNLTRQQVRDIVNKIKNETRS